MICCDRLAKGTNVIGIQSRLNERKYVKHLSSTQQTIIIQWLFGGKFQQNACVVLFYTQRDWISEGQDVPREQGSWDSSKCSFAAPWRHKRLLVSLLRTGTCDVTSFDSFPALICLLFLRTKGSHFKAYFLYNRIQERTYSLWAHLWKNRADYLNPLFRADHSQTRGVLHLPTAPCNFMYKYVNL